MKNYVLSLPEVGRADLALVGGKGANLGELCRLPGIRVPDGFCVTTEAYRQRAGWDLEALLSSWIQDGQAYAVRSSATAEDLPTASFAGLQDTYLNIVGKQAVLEHIRRSWDSLFSERAVAYRAKHGFDDRKVHMAVVVQEMLAPQVSGVLFTADPVTGHRKVAAIEAVAGLGDALVSGRVNPDRYQVREGQVRDSSGQLLTEAQCVRLTELGRQIETHFGEPQDIEWCLVGDDFHFVQSRPITTLYPIPAGEGFHVYVSVGHQQMMTDAMRPLGLSMWQLLAARPMHAAGGRLFVDLTKDLSTTAGRHVALNVLGAGDPLVGDALRTLLERGLFPDPPPDEPQTPNRFAPAPAPPEDEPAALIERSEASIEELRQEIRTRSGPELLDFIREDIGSFLEERLHDPRSFAAIMAGMNAYNWLNEQVLAWLGEKNAADTLALSAPHNVTAEMGLALLDVADALRPYPEVLAYLENATDDGLLEGLRQLAPEAHEALAAWLARYGIRCAGEIDVTRTRWAEAPTTLVPLILTNVKSFPPGAGARKFEEGRQEAEHRERQLLERLLQLPEGEEKVAETQRMVRQLRAFTGYREYPKYAIVSRLFIYKQAILAEAARLGLPEPTDLYYLTFQELREVFGTHQLDEQLVRRRRVEHERNQLLTPPRVFTSDGEVIAGKYRRDSLPAGALVGIAVSTGVVEGRARVLSSMGEAELEAGDILVTTFTDPRWTPAFVSIRGLVTEVGGVMSHGAVIAREYGLPAVVGVENATRLIQDGARVRVNGTEGCVEVI